MAQPEQAFRPFPSGIAHFIFFSWIKTVLPQKHNFCSAVTEPASVVLSGRHRMGHCLLFSPSKLQLRGKRKIIATKKPFSYVVLVLSKIATNAHPEFLSVLFQRLPSFMCTGENEAHGKEIAFSEMEYRQANWNHNPWVCWSLRL